MNTPQHFCLTATKLNGHTQFTVHTNGDIRDAMRELKEIANVNTSHGRGCRCTNPDRTHAGNTVIRDGELIPA